LSCRKFHEVHVALIRPDGNGIDRRGHFIENASR
jgi:hypothetical protein